MNKTHTGWFQVSNHSKSCARNNNLACVIGEIWHQVRYQVGDPIWHQVTVEVWDMVLDQAYSATLEGRVERIDEQLNLHLELSDG